MIYLLIVLSFLCIALIAFIVLKAILTCKQLKKEKLKVINEDVKFYDYPEVDTEGVTSSVYLGEGLYMTEQQYEEYRNDILENCLRSFDEKLN